MARPGWIASRPIAHRGLHDAGRRILENTLPAVEAALEAGFGIEVDVQAAAGLEPVVFHDAALERMTPEVGPIAARTPAELARIPLRGTGERIPTLAAVLDLVQGRSPLIIEVKTNWTGMPDYCRRIADLLNNYAGPAAIMSFDIAAIDVFRRIAPGLPRGVVAEGFWDWMPPNTSPGQRFRMRHLLHSARTRPHFIAYRVDDLPAAAPLALKTLLGLPLLAWTVHGEAQLQRARRWASQIIFEGIRP